MPKQPRKFTDDLRDQILEQLLDSLAHTPNQTPTQRVAETVRIARSNRCTRQQVAAVRAAFTRGSYGNPKRLVSNYKKLTASEG